jgi:folate-binding protein YgfZ
MAPTVIARLHRDLVVVSGPDATSFLQSLVSQDLDPVAVGAAVHALLLEPRGKLVADMRAARVADDEWWCICERGVGEVLAAGLTRFRIRVKVDIEDRSAAVAAAAVRGPAALELAPDVQVIPVDWPGDPGVGIELIGPPDSIDAAVRTLVAHGACEDVDAYEALRIEAGAPRQGYDVDETTIAQEAYLDRDAVSFTKGCFVGQELVCRIDTRGHVNRLLRRLRADVPLERGASVEVDGKAVGAVTSSAGAVGLAMLRREVEAGGSVLVRAGSGDVTARVEAIDADPGSRERVGRS